jgi:hypothetical protein
MQSTDYRHIYRAFGRSEFLQGDFPMMKYQETIEQSAEYLRLALPLMSRQAAALHPVSYGVWYEYVAGFNRPLRNAIDELTRDGKVLDEALTSELFRTHIAELDEQTAHRVATGFPQGDGRGFTGRGRCRRTCQPLRQCAGAMERRLGERCRCVDRRQRHRPVVVRHARNAGGDRDAAAAP